MKKKLLMLPVLMLTLSGLTSCSLFNDDDLKISNSFVAPSEEGESKDPSATYLDDIKGTKIDGVNALCFKSVPYGVLNDDGNRYVANTYKSNEFNINKKEDYYSTKASNNYDLYVPDAAKKDDKHVVILFIHGGAWVSGWKSDVNEYVHSFANKGYITATIKYTLLSRAMDNPSTSIFRDLDEIDACITSIKESLTTLGYDTSKTNLVIGGASSGAHLAMLYAFSRGDKSALPIKFLVDAVGPVDIKEENWKAFKNPSASVLEAGIDKTAIANQEGLDNLKELKVSGEDYNWNEYQTMRIANGMCGLPYTLDEVEQSTNANKETIISPNDASNAMTKAGGGEDQLSVTYYMNNTNKYPMVIAYAGRDSVVGIHQYATLQSKLDTLGTTYKYFYFKDCDHTEINEENDPTQYNAFVNQINDWCKDLL